MMRDVRCVVVCGVRCAVCGVRCALLAVHPYRGLTGALCPILHMIRMPSFRYVYDSTMNRVPASGQIGVNDLSSSSLACGKPGTAARMACFDYALVRHRQSFS